MVRPVRRDPHEGTVGTLPPLRTTSKAYQPALVFRFLFVKVGWCWIRLRHFASIKNCHSSGGHGGKDRLGVSVGLALPILPPCYTISKWVLHVNFSLAIVVRRHFQFVIILDPIIPNGLFLLPMKDFQFIFISRQLFQFQPRINITITKHGEFEMGFDQQSLCLV